MLTGSDRARLSGGATTGSAVYRAVTRAIRERHSRGGTLVDLGCGRGALFGWLAEEFDHYLGVDVVSYDGFPTDPRAVYMQGDLDRPTPLPEGAAEAVCSVETIEHLENPRAFFREVVRLVKPGGLIVVTTPNQLSWMSKVSLFLTGEFQFFREAPGLYPAHITCLLAGDLLRLGRENHLTEIEIRYTAEGRVPLTSRHWPRWLPAASGWRGRAFSDNVIFIARRPAEAAKS